MSKITKVGLVFENCEVMYVDSKDVILLETSVPYEMMSGNFGNLSTTSYINSLTLALLKETSPCDDSTLFDNQCISRITNDVTGIIFIDDDGIKKSHTVKWPLDSDEMYSSNQYVHTTKEGNVVFTVSFNEPRIDDTEIDRHASFMTNK